MEMFVHTCNVSIGKAGAGKITTVPRPSWLHSKFQTSLGHLNKTKQEVVSLKRIVVRK